MEINKRLGSYIPIVKLIATTFGMNCEVVLHDFSGPKDSVVYVENNHVTGRQIGESFDGLVKDLLVSNHFKDDILVNYVMENLNNNNIKSSIALIRDNSNKVIGAMCINYDISKMMTIKKYIDDLPLQYTKNKREKNLLMYMN